MARPTRSSIAPMAVVGLTGGIASGKSTVAGRMAARGVPIIDADQLARAVVEPGSPVLDRIAERFGAGMIRPDGRLDRAALGAHVFADPAELKALNGLTHPAILSEVGNALRRYRAEGRPWVVYEAALILEQRLSPTLATLVAVICDPDTQLARIVGRDGLDEAQARQRIAAQTNNARRRDEAEFLIENTGTLDALHAATDGLINRLEAAFGAIKSRVPKRG